MQVHLSAVGTLTMRGADVARHAGLDMPTEPRSPMTSAAVGELSGAVVHAAAFARSGPLSTVSTLLGLYL